MISTSGGRVSRTMLAIAGLAFCLMPYSAATAAEKWDLYIYNPVSTVAAVKGLNVVIEQIEKETAGELTVRLHLGGSLPINTTTITQAVSDDVVQMGDDGYFLGNVPIGGVLRLPMLIRNLKNIRRRRPSWRPIWRARSKKRPNRAWPISVSIPSGFSSKKLTSPGRH